MREILDVPVRDLMSKPAVTVTPDTSIGDLSRLMNQHEFNGFPVVNDAGALRGMVTRLDLFRLHLVPYRRFIPVLENAWASSVGAIMSPGVVAVDAAEQAIHAIALMVDYRIRTLPVVTDSQRGQTVVGVVTRRDLAKALPASVGAEDSHRPPKKG